MEHTASSGAQPGFTEHALNREAHSSGVSWAAVIAGAFVTAALSLVLLALGAGFGLESVSPWANTGASASMVSKAALIWLIVIQVVASAMGGYLAGRLRTKWATIHTDEVYFRDTAHGFLVWAVAVVMTAAFLGSAGSAMVGGAGTGPELEGAEDGYLVDTLFRGDHPVTNDDSAIRGEAAGILAHAARQGEVPAADRSYLTQLVSARTGLNQSEADKRVSDVITQAQAALDAARKTTARVLLWLFLALLIGAFCASYAATIGGRQRDHVKAL